MRSPKKMKRAALASALAMALLVNGTAAGGEEVPYIYDGYEDDYYPENEPGNEPGNEPENEPENEIVSVQVPSNIDFTIDPFEINGRGQIYSDQYTVRNLGRTNVYFDIVDIDLDYSGGEDFEPLSEPFDEEWQTGRKAIYLSLDFDRNYMDSVVLTDPYSEWYVSASLDAFDGYEDERSSLGLSLSGSVNAAPDNEWERGDVSIELTYSIEPLYEDGEAEGPVIITTPAPLPPAITPLPTPVPVEDPVLEPTPGPTEEPALEPTAEPAVEEPSIEPSTEPSIEPTSEPITEPTVEPTAESTANPSEEPVTEPTEEFSEEPSEDPADFTEPEPTEEPTKELTEQAFYEPEGPEFEKDAEEPFPSPTPSPSPTPMPSD